MEAILTEADKYVRALRNPRKYAYAKAYLDALKKGIQVPPYPSNLTLMGAQSIAMNIERLYEPIRNDARNNRGNQGDTI
jgi:hypothetical protein